MPELIITRGLPGSGKTHFALNWLTEDPDWRGRVNRDELRSLLFNKEGVLDFKEENVISKVQQNAVAELIRSGRSVVIDDTHLRVKYINAWYEFAHKWGAEFRLVDFRDVPIETCIERDAQRGFEGGRLVGGVVIRDMARRLASMQEWVPPTAVEAPLAWRYEPEHHLPRAWIFDIDGTLASHEGIRSPYEWKRVGEDTLHRPVKTLLDLIHASGDEVLIVSGRDGECRPETEEWLTRHWILYRELFMRPAGDNRNDAIIKQEILHDQIAPHYNVLGVFDDRDRVVEMWRSVGLLCCQVAPGDF